MRDWKKILGFVLFVAVGLLLIETLLVGIPGPNCNCFDGSVLEYECAAACIFDGGCEGFRVYFPGYCPDEDQCCTTVKNYCLNGDKVSGHSCTGCFECEIL